MKNGKIKTIPINKSSLCIRLGFQGHHVIIDTTNVVDNRGAGLRFPISSSSGFSSPMKGALEIGPRIYV